MIIYSSVLREREVINICSGKRLGYICDFVIDTDCGRITAIIVSDTFFSLAGGKNSLCIPIANVDRIGKDVVLVRADEIEIKNDKDNGMNNDLCRRKKGGWFFGK